MPPTLRGNSTASWGSPHEEFPPLEAALLACGLLLVGIVAGALDRHRKETAKDKSGHAKKKKNAGTRRAAAALQAPLSRAKAKEFNLSTTAGFNWARVSKGGQLKVDKNGRAILVFDRNVATKGRHTMKYPFFAQEMGDASKGVWKTIELVNAHVLATPDVEKGKKRATCNCEIVYPEALSPAAALPLAAPAIPPSAMAAKGAVMEELRALSGTHGTPKVILSARLAKVHFKIHSHMQLEIAALRVELTSTKRAAEGKTTELQIIIDELTIARDNCMFEVQKLLAQQKASLNTSPRKGAGRKKKWRGGKLICRGAETHEIIEDLSDGVSAMRNNTIRRRYQALVNTLSANGGPAGQVRMAVFFIEQACLMHIMLRVLALIRG